MKSLLRAQLHQVGEHLRASVDPPAGGHQQLDLLDELRQTRRRVARRRDQALWGRARSRARTRRPRSRRSPRSTRPPARSRSADASAFRNSVGIDLALLEALPNLPLLLVQLPLLALQGLAVDELAPQARCGGSSRRTDLARTEDEVSPATTPSRGVRVHPRARRSGEGFFTSSPTSGGGGRTFTENEEGTSARFHIEKKSARLESKFLTNMGFWSILAVALDESERRKSLGNRSDSVERALRVSRKLVCHRAFFRPHISTPHTPSTQLKHRKDGLPLRHQRPRRAARRRAHQQAVRTRFRRETPRKFLPDEARRDADAGAPTRAEAPRARDAAGARDRARGRRGGCASEARAPRVCLAIRSVRRSPAPAEPSTDRARVHLPRCHGCAVFLRSRSTRASRSRAFLERSLTRPLSPSAHQQHLRDVLRREARLRREGREGRQGRHRRPRRVRGPRLGTLTLTTTRSYPIPISARSRVTAGREARANEAEGDARNARESASSARRARSLASSPPVAPAREARPHRATEKHRCCCFVARASTSWHFSPSQSRKSRKHARFRLCARRVR